MSQQGSYTMQQKAFAFSLVSNAAAAITSNFQQAVTDKFNALTSQYAQYVGTGWSMPWGPVVGTCSGVAASNTLMVVQGSDVSNHPVFIVAVAGTNPTSGFDMSVEDLSVGSVVPFNGNASIDQGTNIGVAILEAMASNGQTLQQYLASVASTTATLIFTGHSLGGALAPTLALDLFVNKGLKTSDWGAVYVMPTAGPTPGNQAFVTLFSSTFPAKNGWNQNIVNTLDCVPKAWSDLGSISTIYGSKLPASQCIKNIVTALQLKRGLEQLFYAPLPQAPFTGTFNSSALPPSPYQNDPTCQFAAQELYQHTTAYNQQLVSEVNPLFPGMSLTVAACEQLLNTLCPAVSGA